jgi:hypothetical protein
MSEKAGEFQTICIVALPKRQSLSDLVAGIVTTADQPDRA